MSIKVNIICNPTLIASEITTKIQDGIMEGNEIRIHVWQVLICPMSNIPITNGGSLPHLDTRLINGVVGLRREILRKGNFDE